ncbi:MAG: DUF4270 domain-containing protein [Muribaculaceae bacterium]|nr:DUF4270 domain-containing protein [Muribaculaceae bacterium]
MKRLLIIPAALMALAFAACEDTASPIGSSIVDDKVSIVVDSSFTITGHTVETGAVQSRTLTQLIGSLRNAGFGELSSTVVTQFMPASTIDTAGISVADIDSLVLELRMNKDAFSGDSIAPMGIDVFRLNRDLPSPIYSNFDPAEYYSSTDRLGSAIYSASAIGQSDTVAASDYRYIQVGMPIALARDIFNAYKAHPEYFSNPESFINNVFRGVYISNSYGSGRMSRITRTLMRMYYHHTYLDEDKQRDTTVYHIGNYMAVTPEIVTNNNIRLDLSENIRTKLDAGENLIIAPAGTEVEFKFPAREIVERYRAEKSTSSVINTLKLSIPADTLSNPEGIPAPPYVLLVLADKREEFFANNDLPDNITSFYTAYNTLTKSYDFSGLRSYILNLLDKDEITDADVTFRLCPVQVEFETTGSSYWDYGTTESAVVPYVSGPAMVKISLDKAKISFTYSNQTINY